MAATRADHTGRTGGEDHKTRAGAGHVHTSILSLHQHEDT